MREPVVADGTRSRISHLSGPSTAEGTTGSRRCLSGPVMSARSERRSAEEEEEGEEGGGGQDVMGARCLDNQWPPGLCMRLCVCMREHA